MRGSGTSCGSARKSSVTQQSFSLRYSPVESGPKDAALCPRSLKRLQTTLDDLNDFAIHDKLAKKLVLTGSSRGKYPRRKAFAAGLITGKERSKSRSLLKGGKSALRDVAKAKTYLAASRHHLPG